MQKTQTYFDEWLTQWLRNYKDKSDRITQERKRYIHAYKKMSKPEREAIEFTIYIIQNEFPKLRMIEAFELIGRLGEYMVENGIEP